MTIDLAAQRLESAHGLVAAIRQTIKESPETDLQRCSRWSRLRATSWPAWRPPKRAACSAASSPCSTTSKPWNATSMPYARRPVDA